MTKARHLDEIIPETILLDDEVLGRLHLTLHQCKAKALRGTFPKIRKIAPGKYGVRPEELQVYDRGQWLEKRPEESGVDVAANLRRYRERQRAAARTNRRRPRRSSSSEGGRS